MGFRSTFVKHEGLLACHSEVFLHIVNRLVAAQPSSVLLVGVGNGGPVEIWRSCLPESATLVAVDENPACGDLGLGIHVGCTGDRPWLESVLDKTMFDLIVDMTGVADGAV